jgi:hypothetical protein
VLAFPLLRQHIAQVGSQSAIFTGRAEILISSSTKQESMNSSQIIVLITGSPSPHPLSSLIKILTLTRSQPRPWVRNSLKPSLTQHAVRLNIPHPAWVTLSLFWQSSLLNPAFPPKHHRYRLTHRTRRHLRRLSRCRSCARKVKIRPSRHPCQ